MSIILKLKHYQIFLILLFGSLLTNTTIEGYPDIEIALALVGFILSVSILIAYGHCLFDYLPKNVKLNYVLFVINGFWVIAFVIGMSVLAGPDKTSLTGIYALVGFYFFFALLHIIAFPAKVLKSIELKREAKFGEYIGLFFMIIFWPFCIWFIQPRINRIANSNQFLFE